MLSYQNRIQQAVNAHQAGQLEPACKEYLSLLQERPDDPALLRNLGTLYLQTGRLSEAEIMLSRAVEFEPRDATGHLNLSMVLHDMGKVEPALEHANQAITLNRSSHDALNNRAVIYQSLYRHEDALRDLQRASKLNPVSADVWTNIGASHSALGKKKEAEIAFRRAVTLDPQHAVAAINLGVMLCKNKRYQEATPLLKQAIKLSPSFNDAHANLAGLYQDEGKIAEIVEIAGELNRYAGQEAAINGLLIPLCCSSIGWHKKAAVGNEQLLAEQDKYFSHYIFAQFQYHNLLNNISEADTLLTQLIAKQPDNTVAHWNRSLLRLTSGRLIEGFEEYSWRFKTDGILADLKFNVPEWQGENLSGKGILIHGEQGAGDIIQFMRYLKFVEQRGGKLFFQSGKAVWDLFADEDHEQNVAEAAQASPVTDQPKADFATHIALMSLPKVFKTTLETIPWDGAYVHASKKKSAYWKNKLGEPTHLRVGIVWGGNPEHKNDHNRSCRLSDFAKLATIPGINWYSIQKGKPESQALMPPAGMKLNILSSDIRDFSDTAAIIDNLDLVISVDTSVVHLAGAMDKPAWVLLAFNPDWRWLLDRNDSPWYHSLKLFRQKQFGDWDSAFEQVYQSLTALVKERFGQTFSSMPPKVENNSFEVFDTDVMGLRKSLEYCDGLVGQNQLEPAATLLDMLQMKYSGCAELSVKQSIVAAKKGDIATAISLCEAALAIDPDCPDAVNQVTQLYIAHKDYPEAMKVLQHHLACRPLNVEAWQSISEIYRQQGIEFVANFYAERAADLISEQTQNKAIAQ